MATTRGNAISAYIPAFSKGAQVYGANIASGVITSAHIADGTVVAADVAAGSITSAKLGAGAVTSAKLGTSAVTNTKILSNAIRAAHISANAVTAPKIATNAITTSAKISAAAIVASRLKYQVLSATVANSGVVYSLAHTLGRVPAFVLFSLYGTVSQLKGVATSAGSVGAPTVSAHTSAVIYYAGAKNARFRAMVMI